MVLSEDRLKDSGVLIPGRESGVAMVPGRESGVVEEALEACLTMAQRFMGMGGGVSGI